MIKWIRLALDRQFLPRLYQVRPREAKHRFDLITEALPRVLAVVTLVALTSPANGQGAAEEQAIRKVITDFVEAINRSEHQGF